MLEESSKNHVQSATKVNKNLREALLNCTLSVKRQSFKDGYFSKSKYLIISSISHSLRKSG